MDGTSLEGFFEKKQIRDKSLIRKYKQSVNAINLRNFPCHKGDLNVIEGSSISPEKLPLFLVKKLQNQKSTW